MANLERVSVPVGERPKSRPFRIVQTFKHVVVQYDAALHAAIPHAKSHTKDQFRFLFINHGVQETIVLNNMGYNVPSPIQYQYEYKWSDKPPLPEQKLTAEMLTQSNFGYVLNEMGTGKTRAVIYALDFLMQRAVVYKALIVAPLSTLYTTWEREFFVAAPDLKVQVLHGSREKRLARLKEDADVYIINHDGIGTIKDELLRRTDINLTVIDELGDLRNARTRRWKGLKAVVKGMQWGWGMTGDPTPNNAAEAWAQCRLLTPHTVPAYFTYFKQQVMRQVSQFRWVDKDNANDKVLAAMQPSVRFTRQECIKIPSTVYHSVQVGLSPTQTKVLKQLKKDMFAQFQTGAVTAVNAGVLQSKLVQVASGFVFDAEKKIHTFDADERYNKLLELIDASAGKVLVFVPFVPLVHTLHKRLSAHISTEIVYGDTSLNDRTRIFNDFQYSADPKLIVAHPKTMAHGLTLTAATTTVWYAPYTSFAIYEQANARTPRIGQTKNTLIYHVAATTLEARMYKKLENRQEATNSLLEMFQEETKNRSVT